MTERKQLRFATDEHTAKEPTAPARNGTSHLHSSNGSVSYTVVRRIFDAEWVRTVFLIGAFLAVLSWSCYGRIGGIHNGQPAWSRVEGEQSSANVGNENSRVEDRTSKEGPAQSGLLDGFYSIAGNFRCPGTRRYTPQEVAQHVTVDDLWIVIDNNVLDVSGFVSQHPGGAALLEGAGGMDMATEFSQFHHPSTVNLFSGFCIGRIREE